MTTRTRKRRRKAAHPAPGPYQPKGSPPGPYDPPSPPPAAPPRPRGDLPVQYRPSAMYPGQISVWPEETCRHGFHGAVTA